MNPQQIKQIPASLSAILQGLRLYPGEHPQVRRQLDNALATLRPHLQEQGQLQLGFAEETLMVEDLPCIEQHPAILDFTRKIRECELKGISFHAGVDARQLLELMTELNRGNTEIADTLEILGVEHIRVIPKEESPREVYRQALEVVSSLFEDARLGRKPSTSLATGTVQKMVSSTIGRPYALLAMTLLKDYDNYTFTHSVNVSIISLTVGRACGLNEDQLNLLGMGGMMHDLGKMTIAREIITKPGKLNDAERLEMMEHPQRGVDIVSRMEGVPAEVVDIIHHHHLRHDRKGYPAANRGRKLSPLVDMVALADTFDAMTTVRCYQKPFSPKTALDRLREMSGSHLNPTHVEQFIAFLGPYPVGTLIRLDSGEIALVVDQNHRGEGSLKLKIAISATGERLVPPRVLELPDSTRILAEVDPLLKGIKVDKLL